MQQFSTLELSHLRHSCTGMALMVDPRFREYEEEKLRSPACCIQDNATFSPPIHRTWGPPFYAIPVVMKIFLK